MSLYQYEQARAVKKVRMNEVGFIDFRARVKAIGTRDLAGCHVVVIGSTYGAIMAHISPHPGHTAPRDPSAGDRHIAAMMDKVRDKYQLYPQHFPSLGSDTWTVHAVFEGSVALPDQKDYIVERLEDMGLPAPEESFYTVNAAQARNPRSEKGTVLMIGTGTSVPLLYVEDKLVEV